MYEIYLITNKINGKVYVGQSKQGKEYRWKTHVRDSKIKSSRLYSAFRKYGPESFSIDSLGFASTPEELDNLERMWIVLLNSKNPDIGYNMSNGGEGNSGLKHGPDAGTRKPNLRTGNKNGRYRDDISSAEIIDLYLSGKSCVEIASLLSVNKTVVLKRLKAAKVPRRSLSDAATRRCAKKAGVPESCSEISEIPGPLPSPRESYSF